MYLVLSAIVFIISTLLFRKAAGTLSVRSLNMISWIFYYDLIIGVFISAVLVIHNFDNHYLINHVSENAKRMGYYAIMYTMISIPLGMIIANTFFNCKKINNLFNKYLDKSLVIEPKANTLILFFLKLASLLSALCVIYVFFVLKEFPLIKLLKNNSAEELMFFRISSSRNFQGSEYLKNITLIFTPLLSYIAYGYKNISKKMSDKIWFYLMFLFSIFILTYNLAKAPLLTYILGFLFFNFYTKRNLNFKYIAYYGIVIFSLTISFYFLLLKKSNLNFFDLFKYNSGIVGRSILSQSAGVYLSVDIFPQHVSHIGFNSFSRFFSNVLGEQYQERSARILMETVNYNGVFNEQAGVINSLFIAEAWANWGIWGVIITPLWVGFVIQCLYIFLLKKKKTPYWLGLFVYFSINGSITGGINDYFFNFRVLIILFFL
ncbi:MAG: oligosaccharide repeat unit polymerase [Tannerellaceae bacterium]|jgi:hypothetical protein|nr:oligosaccharide repeat unit polymerase [Tannerellaceae bacterium]